MQTTDQDDKFAAGESWALALLIGTLLLACASYFIGAYACPA